jgi:hypothetical protein
MTTDLIRFTQWARESPQRQYTSVMGMLYDPVGLNASFERQTAALFGSRGASRAGARSLQSSGVKSGRCNPPGARTIFPANG